MVDTEKIKGAFTDFENDDFIAAKETLSAEIKSHMNDYFKEKLGLKGDVVDIPAEEEESDDKTGDDVVIDKDDDKSTDDDD